MRTKTRQPDLFDTCRQAEMFEQSSRPVHRPTVPSVEFVRAKMLDLIDQLKQAVTLPWNERNTTINEIIFPQMSKWLPEDEAAQLVAEFSRELARLKTRSH
jgi:hypothetical protein